MPGSVIGTILNNGYPGQISRHGDEVSRTFAVKKDTDNIVFGAPVALNDDGTVQLFGDGHTADKFAGVALRRVKSATEWPNQSMGVYRPEEACDVLERGSVVVECLKGTPKPGGKVYAYIATKNGFAAEADGSNTVELTGVRWSTGKDSNNVAELTILIRAGI